MAIHVNVRKSGLESSGPSRIFPQGCTIKNTLNANTVNATATYSHPNVPIVHVSTPPNTVFRFAGAATPQTTKVPITTAEEPKTHGSTLLRDPCMRAAMLTPYLPEVAYVVHQPAPALAATLGTNWRTGTSSADRNEQSPCTWAMSRSPAPFVAAGRLDRIAGGHGMTGESSLDWRFPSLVEGAQECLG